MFGLEESPLSMDLWLRTLGLASLTSVEVFTNGNDDVLVPPFDADTRRASLFVSKAVVILSLVGSGCLGLPYAFTECGVSIAITILVVLAVLTDRSLYLLWICARKTGSATFGGIVRISFGNRGHWIVTAFLFAFLLLLLTSYMSLTRDIFTPLVQTYLPEASPSLIMFWLQILLLPLFWQYSLHFLWFPVCIGIVALIVTFSVICYEANNYGLGGPRALKSFPDTLNNIMSGLNILLLNIVVSFNILYIHSSLRYPTHPRMQGVVRNSVVLSVLIATGIGVAGQHFFQVADDEIPANFLYHKAIMASSNHQVIYLASGITVWLATPLILIPCRDNLLELIETLVLDGRCPEVSDCQDEIETWTTRSSTQSGQHYNNLVIVDESTNLLPSIDEDPRCELNLNPYAHYGSILGIMAVSEVLTLSRVIVPNIWRILAPSLVLSVAFILPAACYLEIHKRQTHAYKTFSRCLIVFSIVLAFLCTVEAARDVVLNH